MKRILSPENEIPICKDQRSQSLKIPTSTSTSTKKKSVPDQRSHTMKACYTNQKRLPKPKPKPKPSPPAEEWEKYLDEVERDEEQIRDENIRNFFAESAAMDSFTADFSHGSGFTELRYFTPTQIPLKLWQITARLWIISGIIILIFI